MGATTIKHVYARQVFSGRGNPAVEATVITENGEVGIAQCTAGVSVGEHEAPFVYDNNNRWHGKGVQIAADNIKDYIAPAIIGMDSTKQAEVDFEMLNLFGSETKRKVGANAIAAVSAAVLKAGAASLGIPLYRHVGGENAVTLPCADYGSLYGGNRYIPGIKSGSKPTHSFIAYDFSSFSEASEALYEVCSDWWDFACRRFGVRPSESSEFYTAGGMVNIPGGLVKTDAELWDMMTEIIVRDGYNGKIGFQVDMAADTFYDKSTGLYEGECFPGKRDRDEQIAMVIEMCRKWPFVAVEDPLNENDYEGHALLTEKTGIQIVGDDLFTTDINRLKEGAKINACNTVLLKVNQIGSITEAMEMIKTAGQLGYGVMPCSSRGESVDICDYSVGINAGTIREAGLGSPAVRFLQIEQELGKRAKFAGKAGLKGWKFHKDGGNKDE